MEIQNSHVNFIRDLHASYKNRHFTYEYILLFLLFLINFAVKSLARPLMVFYFHWLSRVNFPSHTAQFEVEDSLLLAKCLFALVTLARI